MQEKRDELRQMDEHIYDSKATVDDLQEEIKEGNRKVEELSKQNKAMEEKANSCKRNILNCQRKLKLLQVAGLC